MSIIFSFLIGLIGKVISDALKMPARTVTVIDSYSPLDTQVPTTSSLLNQYGGLLNK